MTLIIRANKKRFPKGLVIGIIVSALFVFGTIDHKDYDGFYGFMYLSNYFFLSALAIAFTIACLAEYLRTLFYKKAALTITDYGINDRLGIFSCGEIGWEEISDIRVTNALNINLIVVVLLNPTEIIEKQNKLKQKILKSSLKKFGSPVVISGNKINCDLQELNNTMLTLKNKLPCGK
jgi:hypothetical protein